VSRRVRAFGAGVTASVCLLLLAGSAQAAFPGANGKIATAKDNDPPGIHALNPDGTGNTALTSATDHNPAWSPDGTRIAFDRSSDIYVMEADGSHLTQLTTNPAADKDPAWSPDGSQLAFESDRGGSLDIWTMNADGSGPVRLTTDPASDVDPSWSPNGSKIAFSSDRESFACDDPDNYPDCVPRATFRIFTMSPNGANTTRVTLTTPYFDCYAEGQDHVAPDWSPAGDQIAYMGYEYDNCVSETYYLSINTTAWGNVFYQPDYSFGLDPFFPPAAGPAWSPDGRQIAFHLSRILRVYERGVGTRTVTSSCCYVEPSWQPIPINAYPRPKGASPTYLSLVPAYTSCASPNTQHGAPLDSPSCTPPVRASSALTLGTPDANGLAAGSVGWAIFRPKADKPSTPADEADARLDLSVTDVRQASDLADYAGALEARPVIRITDRDNTPSPGGPGAATVTDVPFPYPVPCTPTATAPGSTCQTATSANAVAPGAITGGDRAIWQIQSFEVRDGTGAPFLRQGVFVP
jgi:WD40-like Beta Propeller Repeat